MRTRAGLSTEAVYIFHNMLRRLISVHHPEYLAAVFESEGPTFREQEFADYKANRSETPPELLEQIPWVRRLLEAMRIPVLNYAGFEADDVIGAIARKAAAGRHGAWSSFPATRTCCNWWTSAISMLNPMKRTSAVRPGQGEGVHGRGARPGGGSAGAQGRRRATTSPARRASATKGARDLIARFGSVESALERAAEVERRTYRESLQNNRDQILLSKRLATIDSSVPVDWEPGAGPAGAAGPGGAARDL